MKSSKISVSVPADVIREARQRTAGRSLSAYVTEGIRRQLLADRQGALIAEWEAEFGTISEHELDQARQWLAD